MEIRTREISQHGEINRVKKTEQIRHEENWVRESQIKCEQTIGQSHHGQTCRTGVHRALSLTSTFNERINIGTGNTRNSHTCG